MKNKTIIVKIMLSFLLAFILVAINPGTAAAAQDGAEVPTKGEITLVDDTDSSSSEPKPTNPSSAEPTNPTDSSGATVKPKGKLPSTGELINYGLLGGGAFVVLAVLFYFVKRQKDRQGTGKGGQR